MARIIVADDEPMQVTDIFMPDVDGIQLVAAIRAGIPVIAMTGGLQGRIASCDDIMTRLGACRAVRRSLPDGPERAEGDAE